MFRKTKIGRILNQLLNSDLREILELTKLVNSNIDFSYITHSDMRTDMEALISKWKTDGINLEDFEEIYDKYEDEILDLLES